MGIAGIVAVVLSSVANAADERKPCYGLLEGEEKEQDTYVQKGAPLMTRNECEAAKRHQLQMLLLEIPQEGEDPIGLSLGSREEGGMIYLKIPFSF